LPTLWHHHGLPIKKLEETMPIQLPAAWVSAGHGVPTVCVRHGQPGTLRARTEFESAPARWSYAFIPLGLLIFVLIRAATRKRIDAPAWYYCDSCRSMRRVRRLAWAVPAALGAGLLVYSFVEDPANPDPWLFIGGALGGLTGYLGLLTTTLAAIARGRVSRDGQWIVVRRPAPAFAAAAEAALEHGRNHPPAFPPPTRTHEHAAREIFGHTMP
jgi:hypothetical protein